MGAQVMTGERAAPAASHRTGDGARGFLRNGLGLVPIAIALVIWEIVVRTGDISPALMPSVGAIGGALYDMIVSGSLLQDLAATFGRLLYGIIIGAFFGTLMGGLMGYFPIWERLFGMSLNFFLAIPGTALFPLTMIWFGFNEWAILSILIFEVALTVTTTTWNGVKSIDRSLIRAARAFGASGLGMLWRVLIPGALPAIITGYRIAFSRAWRILVVAEMLVAVTAGLGYQLYAAKEFFHTDRVYAGLIVVGLAGLLLERVVLRSLEVATVERWGTMRGENG